MQTCFIHELGRSPGGWDGNPLQYSYPENFMERGAWQVYSPWGHKDLDLTEWLTLLKTSLVVQWLRLHASTAGETGYIPGWGTKIPYASWCNNKKIKFDILGFPGGSDSKESACNAGDPGPIPGSGRSPGEGIGYPLQYSCLENSMDRGAWWAKVHGVTNSQTQLSD